jgi:DNA-binding transcriptional ArsR family regulator
VVSEVPGEQKGVTVITDPDVAKLFGDETRRRIIHLLTYAELSPADIVKETGKNFSSIAYHLEQLEKAGLIEKTRVEVVQNKLQPRYKATALNFQVSYSLDETLSGDEYYRTWQDDLTKRLLEGLKAYGVDIPEADTPRAKRLLHTLYILEKKEYEEQLEARTPGMTLEPYVGKTLSHMLSHMRLRGDPEYAAAADELHQLLRAANPKL